MIYIYGYNFTLLAIRLIMRISTIVLACFASLALGQGQPCAVFDCDPPATDCFCEINYNSIGYLAYCAADGTCGCPDGQKGVCIAVCLATFFIIAEQRLLTPLLDGTGRSTATTNLSVRRKQRC